MTVFPSQGNFVFVKLPEGANGVQVRDRLLAEHGVLVRECGNKLGSSSQFMRLVVRSEPDVQRLLSGLSNVLYGSAWYAPLPGGQQLQAACAPTPGMRLAGPGAGMPGAGVGHPVPGPGTGRRRR